MRTTFVFSALLLAATTPLSASILFSSQGASDVDEWNDYGGTKNANVSLYRPGFDAGYLEKNGYDRSWDELNGAVWVSYADTVCPGCTSDGAGNTIYPALVPPSFYPASATLYNSAPGQHVSFYARFVMPDGERGSDGYLDFLGDDSVRVYLNEQLIGTFVEPASGTYNFQLDSLGNPRGIAFSSFASALTAGENILRFDVTNLGAGDEGVNGGGVSSFGLAYSFELETEPIPEPATTALIALGGLGLLAYKRFRR